MGIRRLNIQSDSQVVVNQVGGGYQAKDMKMTSYLEHVKELRKEFLELNFVHVDREENLQADALANLGSAMEATGISIIPLVVVHWPAVWKQPSEEQVPTIKADELWTALIIEYIQHGKLPADKIEAR